MKIIKLELPVYMWTTKNKKTLINMNWYRNAHFQVQNKIKKEYYDIVRLKLLGNKIKITGAYEVSYKYYYKTITSDLTNVTSVIDKFLNDTLQELKIVENDNVKYLRKVTCEVVEKDVGNPRVEIEIRERV